MNKLSIFLKRFWFFIWEDDSIYSWIANIIIAYILVKFIIYPGLGLIFGTHYPVVAVVSSSMTHHSQNFEDWWSENKGWYLEHSFDKDEFERYKFKDGFNKGDVMVLFGTKPKEIKIGDIIVYQAENFKYPIIHRVVKISQENNRFYFATKGDNNAVPDYKIVSEEQIQGKAVFRLPYLGWLKIIFINILFGR